VGLLPEDAAETALSDASVIWSPRTNVALYGNTAPVTLFAQSGVRIGMGTDWTPSGSIHMLRELQCAAYLDDTHFGDFFSDRDLWAMATVDNAAALAIDGVVGVLYPGRVADIAVFADDGSDDPFSTVIEANQGSVALVVRGGEPLYGDTDIMSAIPGGQTGCEALPESVCEVAKTACLERDTGRSYAELASANSSNYALIACGVPEGEPTCVPSRPGEYDGSITATDADGDGVADDVDNCPNVFNPVRPVDGDTQGRRRLGRTR